MKPDKRKSLRLIKRLKKNPQKMLTVILLGNNIVNVAATAYATVLANAIFEDNAITVVTAVMTASILIFGEILPKAIANRYAFTFSTLVIYPLYLIELIFYPIIWILEKLISGLLHLFGEKDIQSVTEDELRAMVNIGAEEGSLEKHEQELIQNVLEFDNTQVEDIMVPRINIDAMADNTTVEEAIKFINEKYHSRIPIYKGYRENIVGVLNAKDLLKMSLDKSSYKKTLKEVDLQDIVKCPNTKKIHDLFHELQQRRQHMAFVYDEHGGLEGLVTTEDILEELVGEIRDEFDHDEEDKSISRLDNNSILVEGSTELKEITDHFSIDIKKYNKSDTVSLIVLDKLNRYPRKGEVIEVEGKIKLQIQRMDSKKKLIEKVKVSKLS